MSNFVELDEFKQQVAHMYSQRSNHDEGDFQPRLAHRLIEYAKIRSGQKILDIATFFAFGREAAKSSYT